IRETLVSIEESGSARLRLLVGAAGSGKSTLLWLLVGVAQFAGRTVSSRRIGHGAVPEPSSARARGRGAARQRGSAGRSGRRRLEFVGGGGRARSCQTR